MYKLGIKAVGDPAENRKIINFLEGLGYYNKFRFTGLTGDGIEVIYVVKDGDDDIHCICNSQIVDLLFNNIKEAEEYINQHKEFMNKEIKIQVPEGYEIDTENSTFECIKFKKKELTYEDLAKKLFKNECYFSDLCGKIHHIDNLSVGHSQPNNCTSEKQAEKLLAINKLMNVAKYLNNGWKPNWEDSCETKYYIRVNSPLNELVVEGSYLYNEGAVYFKSSSLAKQAIEILGKKTIRLALTTDY